MELTEHAFGEFYRREARPLWTYVYRVTGSAADADDIVQEAFVRVLRADVTKLDDAELRRYVFRIASNLVTDRWRRSARERAWLSQLAATVQESKIQDDSDDLSRTLAALKPRERALLWLAYVEGEDHQHIADVLGIARGSVKVLLSRARAKLRNLITATGVTVRAR